jgi:uncharacterized coiled-coil protein SlyX
MPGTDEPWRLDKHIPVAVIFTILIQTGGLVWWAAGISSRVDEAERVNARQESVIDAIRADVQAKSDRVAETQRILSEQIVEQRSDLRAIRELMQRIETRLDQSTSPRRP